MTAMHSLSIIWILSETSKALLHKKAIRGIIYGLSKLRKKFRLEPKRAHDREPSDAYSILK